MVCDMYRVSYHIGYTLQTLFSVAFWVVDPSLHAMCTISTLGAHAQQGYGTWSVLTTIHALQATTRIIDINCFSVQTLEK